MSEVLKLLQPEWRHSMPYFEFLNKVIEYGLNELGKKRNINNSQYIVTRRAYIDCKGRSILWLKEAYNRAAANLKYSEKYDSSFLLARDVRKMTIAFVLMCVAEAYGQKLAPGFITEKAKRVVKEILNQP